MAEEQVVSDQDQATGTLVEPTCGKRRSPPPLLSESDSDSCLRKLYMQ